jgi:hypothetical protein
MPMANNTNTENVRDMLLREHLALDCQLELELIM